MEEKDFWIQKTVLVSIVVKFPIKWGSTVFGQSFPCVGQKKTKQDFTVYGQSEVEITSLKYANM